MAATFPGQQKLKKAQAEMIRQLTSDLGVPMDVQVALDNALYQITEDSGERWLFVKISPAQWYFVMQATRNTKYPDLTLRVWNAAVLRMRQDSGEILATREQIAEDAWTSPDAVSRAMSALESIGAIKRTRRGNRIVYSVNPTVGWNGGEGARLAAAQTAPKLRLVTNNTK